MSNFDDFMKKIEQENTKEDMDILRSYFRNVVKELKMICKNEKCDKQTEPNQSYCSEGCVVYTEGGSTKPWFEIHPVKENLTGSLDDMTDEQLKELQDQVAALVNFRSNAKFNKGEFTPLNEKELELIAKNNKPEAVIAYKARVQCSLVLALRVIHRFKRKK
jgi:hypothetical protein